MSEAPPLHPRDVLVLMLARLAARSLTREERLDLAAAVDRMMEQHKRDAVENAK